MNAPQPPSFSIEALKRYGLALWRRAWLILGLAILGMLAGYLYSRAQTPMYASSMRVMVVRPLKEQSSDLTFWMSNNEVAQTYSQLTQTARFSQRVIERAEAIGFVTAFALPDAQFIILSAQTPDPAAAAPLLNAALEVLADEIRFLQDDRYAQVEDSLNTQVENINLEIEETRTALAARYTLLVAEEKTNLEAQIFQFEEQLAVLRASSSPNSQQISQVQTRLIAARQVYAALLQTNRLAASRDTEISRLERNLALYQNLYNNLMTNRENTRLLKLQGTPALIKVEEPFEPLEPYTPRTRRNALLGGLAGLGLALGLALALEFLNDTLKTAETARQRLGIPVLAQILLGSRPGDHLPVENNPRLLESEAYRILRTNLAFSAIDRPLQIILLTSPGPGEGKSTLAVNLAAVLSQSGRKVLLVDANLRRPALHNLLDLQNRFGLSDAFYTTEIALSDLIQSYRGQNGVDFDVLTSGALAPNPLELLGSERMMRILGQAAEMFDVVLLDTPGLILPDAQVLAAHADGILLVGWLNRTRVGAAQHALEMLAQSRTRVLGVALNAIPGQGWNGRGS